MKTLTTSLLVFLTCALVSVAADFRYATWGMSKADVEASESAELIFTKNNRAYCEDYYSGQPVSIIYVFNNVNDLDQGFVSFLIDDIEPEHWIKLWESLVAGIAGKYGEPVSNESFWIKETFKYTTNLHSAALLLGELQKEAVWETETSRIELFFGILEDKNGNSLGLPKLNILYSPKENHDSSPPEIEFNKDDF